MTREPALAAGVAGFFTRPLVSRALLVRGLSTLTGDLTLLGAIHRCKSTIFFSHVVPLELVRRVEPELQPRCHDAIAENA